MGRSRTRRAGGGAASPACLSAQEAIAAAMGGDDMVPTVRSARPLASLWAGYGTVTEVETEEGGRLVVKEVAPPRGHGISHDRKLASYVHEAAFYGHVAPALPAGAACHVPRCLGVECTLGGGRDGGGGAGASGMRLVLSDLRTDFPSRCGGLDEAHVMAALEWLAAFHAACWGADPQRLGLWPEGTYWHLQTRLDEWEEIGGEWAPLKAAAHELDARLRATPFRTLVHGDFKTDNLLFGGGPDGRPRCAAYDFQYCGGGSGMKDVAYLLISGVSQRVLQREEPLLRHYHARLREGLAATAAGGGAAGVADAAAAAHAVERYDWEAMLVDYRLAVADNVRFLAGWGWWGNTRWASTKARRCLAELGLGA